jgi:hypothetical protein
MKRELDVAESRLRKFAPRPGHFRTTHKLVYIIPDREEDPPDDTSGVGPAGVLVAGGLIAFAALLLASRLARRQ